ncbi:formate hydrogenlyase maturation HycH family protein [Shewanella dokdonensis]|uniref:Formate hydrogenlyase maturation HycH family protein n=1 Tax=Shewanella dokdonensis TaxID=712036 RepID=A0ABX8DHI5_9GAMM|nr:formate hydrogenlyase maturation HycH family protein [Shewanella dokdonensis]MCL1074099.1 formate hydrogenlyase maturation HycH family protein [Shewanella dokdonensis]QVK23840.1 formate hydrogenlyase maturation HycH family protein [Shewanella dokdonensis]
MSESVTFFILNQKFVDDKDAKPESQQLVYYGLAIGHHLGVIDCFKPALTCPLPRYQEWLDAIPDEPARQKLAGIPKYGEIVINSTHVVMLAEGLAAMRGDVDDEILHWRDQLMTMLEMIQNEPAIHLIVRRLND